MVVHPVVLGGGKRLFPGGRDLLQRRLVESRSFDSSTVLLRHEPIETGLRHEPTEVSR